MPKFYRIIRCQFALAEDEANKLEAEGYRMDKLCLADNKLIMVFKYAKAGRPKKEQRTVEQIKLEERDPIVEIPDDELPEVPGPNPPGD